MNRPTDDEPDILGAVIFALASLMAIYLACAMATASLSQY